MRECEMVCPMSWVDVPIGENGRSDKKKGQRSAALAHGYRGR